MAIALLAALAVAITRSSGTAEQNGGIEHNRIVVSQLIRYAAGIAASIDRMRMDGVSENDLDFETTGLTGYTNAKCTSDDCKVFGAGGAQSYSVPPGVNDGSSWIFTAVIAVPGAGDDANNDLLAVLPGVTAGLCQEIDSELGSATIPAFAGTAAALAVPFTGAYPAVHLLGGAAKQSGCAKDAAGVYFFYYVLLAR